MWRQFQQGRPGRTLSRRRPAVSAGLAVLLLLLAFSACGGPKRIIAPGGNRQKFSVQVNAAADANQNTPTPVDLVMVLDKKLVKEVAKLSAKDWFVRRQQFTRDFPDQLKVVSWEWVPGQQAGPIAIDIDKKTRSAFLFAQYSQEGDHRAVVDLKAPLVITLSKTDFSLQPLR
ncbi:MAG: hypothetical protein NTV70_20620 [Acidobacteria bacterium]|nr:hypothetical protein [Acidobacteriota bacterium]